MKTSFHVCFLADLATYLQEPKRFGSILKADGKRNFPKQQFDKTKNWISDNWFAAGIQL